MMPRVPTLVLLAALSASCVSAPSPLTPGFAGAVGAPHAGVQTDSVELPPRGEGYLRFRPKSPHYFGRPRLVTALERVARELAQAEPGAPPLIVGDLSAKHGGKIPGHQSHRTGRDVDLLYYYRTPGGARVTAPGFIHVASDGLALVPETGDLLRFDVELQWRLTRALLEAPEIGVQFMFVSRAVEALLIDYALARGEPLELVLRAQSVMLEPGDSTPHDDHVHVRIACTPEEALSGCFGGGPHWEWLAPLPTPDELDGRALALLLDDPAPGPVLEEAVTDLAGGGASLFGE